MAISTNLKPAIYRNLYENTGPGDILEFGDDDYMTNIVEFF